MPEGRIDTASLARYAVLAESVANETAANSAAGPVDAKAPSEQPLRALIYQPCRSAMSSGGKAATPFWLLEFEWRSPSLPDPLMGWSSSADTLAPIRLKFLSRETAITYARRHGIVVTVAEPHRPKLVIRSYASNFIGHEAVGVSGRVTRS